MIADRKKIYINIFLNQFFVGYINKHFTIKHSTNFVGVEDKNIHIENIERCRDVKEWCKRPGIRTK